MKKRWMRLAGIFMAVAIALQVPATVLADTVSSNGVENEISPDAEDTTDETEDVTGEEDEARAGVREKLLAIVDKKPVLAILYQTDTYPLKKEASADAVSVGNVASGTQLEIQDIAWDVDGTVFYKVQASVNGTALSGYVEGTYVVTNDQDFNEWKSDVLSEVSENVMTLEGTSIDQIYANFPRGYWDRLISLAQAHPNWIFVPFQTGLEWSDVVAAERV